MKNKLLKNVIVYGVSLLIVGLVIAGFNLIRNGQQGEVLSRETEQETGQELQEARPVMTQEEMEELYDRHKAAATAPAGTSEAGPVTEAEDIGEEAPEQTPEAGAEGEEQEQSYTSPVDFEGMWKVNPDVYAWITVPGTVIDYPVLQHPTDNTYYLNYNIDGSYGYPGCIYTETMNAKDFSDNNTVIYGHNMKNGTMFSDLHKFEDSAFFEKNDRIIIYMPEQELEYTIFAAYVYDDRHLLYSFNFADRAVYANYLETVQNMRDMNANIREDITVTAENKIITLVTCIGDQPEKRLLVQAVLNEGEVSKANVQ